MSKKQSSVEWLFVELWNTPKDKFQWQSIFEQAKAMHKEEIEEAQSIAISKADMTNNRGYFDTEQYYNETFGGQDNE